MTLTLREYGTDATTRVLVGSSDGNTGWTTVGVHPNVIRRGGVWPW